RFRRAGILICNAFFLIFCGGAAAGLFELRLAFFCVDLWEFFRPAGVLPFWTLAVEGVVFSW
ncbi:MAG TPA: hypothetical protein DDX91_09375, partial [Ruminococcaceae bacterium]|nr:hypothetical protein [Oscillospiraceae bacterium]